MPEPSTKKSKAGLGVNIAFGGRGAAGRKNAKTPQSEVKYWLMVLVKNCFRFAFWRGAVGPNNAKATQSEVKYWPMRRSAVGRTNAKTLQSEVKYWPMWLLKICFRILGEGAAGRKNAKKPRSEVKY